MTRVLQGATDRQIARATAHLFDLRQTHLGDFELRQSHLGDFDRGRRR